MSNSTSTSEDETVRRRGSYSKISCQQREIFIQQYEEGKTISEAASIANINVNSAKTILYKYKRADDEIIINKRGGIRKEKVTENVLTFVEGAVEQNPCITLKTIKQKLFEHSNINLSIQTVANCLKRLKITLKKASIEVEKLNDERTLDLRREYSLNFTQNSPENRSKIFFIDESGFNLHLRRTRARSRIGTSANVVVPTVRGRNVTLIAAISVAGVVHHNIIANSNYNSAKFGSFLRELLEKIRIQGLQNVWLVMDNAAIHKTAEIRDNANLSSAELVFLSPYLPMLNPIEQVKLAARQILSKNVDHLDMVHVINQALQTVTQNDCNNYNTSMLMKLPQAVDRQVLH